MPRRAAVIGFVVLFLGSWFGLYFADPRLLSDFTRIAVTLAFAAVVAVRPPSPAAWRRLSSAFDWLHARQRLVVPAFALAAFVEAALVCHFVLDPIPHVADEVAYLFQARVFAAGRLSVPAPPLPEFFAAHWVIPHDGIRFSLFPPGFSLLLAVGVLLGVPSFVNPLLTGLSLFSIHRLAVRVLGEKKALAVAALCLVSPFFVFMGASFMSHPASLLLATLTTLFLIDGSERHRFVIFACAGLCAGFGFLVRPLDAFVLWLVPALVLLSRNRTPRQLAGTALSGLGLAAGVALYLAYNHLLSGRFLVSLVTLDSERNRLGLGPDVGLGWGGFSPPGHTLYRGFVNLNHNLAVLGIDLFGWPVTSLWPLLLLLFFGKRSPLVWLIGASLAVYAFAYLFYWYHGVCFGARFYFSLFGFLVLLTIEGLAQAPRVLDGLVGGGLERWRARVLGFTGLCFVFAALVYVPVVGLIEPYHEKRGVSLDLRRFVDERRIDRGVVFVSTGPGGMYLYLPGFAENELDPHSGRIVYATERDADDEKLGRLLPGRPVYHFVHGKNDARWPPVLRSLLRRGSFRRVLEVAPVPVSIRRAFRP